MPLFKRSLAGPGYVVLNVIRVCNIICLLAIVAASAVMLVKTFIVSKFFFFDGVSHVITAALSLFLIITELPLLRGYVARNWPLLGPQSGFVTLGVLMIILGVSILGNLNKQATSQKSLGTSFWQIVISSGIVVIIFGVVNLFASYIFRNKKQDITARQVRAHGATSAQKTQALSYSPSNSNSSRRRSFHLNRSDTLPSYYTQSPRNPDMRQTRNISAPVNVDHSQFDKFKENSEPVGLQRPDSALHPAYNSRNNQF
ncbi:MAG: hypothetical protein HETSPECPRED_008247 [Heterodermia speciosa]|uniref:DUF7598 domain-containing protein n=1 Tax=Heterodermia speciosa TaxID=116794 RepID=A0A8H3FWI1_9LECA|nr:MAG: hypothetical protein HETSPECPRED_008247 [Heterodermia speciosa]